MQVQPQRRHRGRAAAAPGMVVPSPLDPPGPLVQSSAPDVAPAVASRTRRNWHPPLRYRDQADGSEEFDIHHHSDVSDDTDPSPHDPHYTAAVVANTATPNALATNNSTSGRSAIITNPLATNRSAQNPVEDPLATNTSSASNKAFNIEYFFRKETEDTICEVCDPKTSNTPLRHHVKVRHPLHYLEQVEKHR
ncbi:hypothetical protein PAXINDRAFT_153716 [Paxillus involutus ATCC 200175]|nr:hypothetical protein PAXINDRAFT_153716 [Paxillus involutus ATCC 200175]